MIASFNRFEIDMTAGQAERCSHQGACDADVAELLKQPLIVRQLALIPDEVLASELREYGAWDDTELSNRAENNARIIWLAAGNIKDELFENERTFKP